MNTEITDAAKLNGWVCYDADCGFCVRLAERFRGLLAGRRFELAPLQAPWVKERLGLDGAELLTEMRLVKPDGSVTGGADALLEVARAFWWAWPVRQLGRIPAMLNLFRAAYRWVARRRTCANGACEIKTRSEVLEREVHLGAHRAAEGRRTPRRFAHAEPHRNRGSVLECASPLALSYASGGNELGTASVRAGSTPHVVSYKVILDILPLVLLPLAALLCRPHLTPWVFMWAMAFALYGGCKWLTCRLVMGKHVTTPWSRINLESCPENTRPPTASRRYSRQAVCATDMRWLLRLGYLFVWPGMNARAFFERSARVARPRGVEWAFGVAKTVLGIFLLWVIARTVMPTHPLCAGWIGMTGVVFMLHFGLFHLLSLTWRRLGINAAPVMQNPLMAKSLADFWGARWNTAFNELAFRFTFRPLRRLTTPAVAMMAVFGLSGLIHELVISLPARGGYGLPTLYFLAQGAGVLIERSEFGKRLGLGRGLRGWLFTLLVTAGPAFWLFHPPFIHNEILPMLTAIGAT